MRSFLYASALALAAASMPAALNAQAGMAGMSWSATPDQQAMIGGWPADRQAMYNAWAPTLQEYFWTLTPNQQTGWWALTDEQRAQVYAMTPDLRTQAWNSIEAQLAGTPAPAMPAQTQANPVGSSAAPVATPDPMSAAEPVPPAQPDDSAYHAGPYKGALTAPPAEAMRKTYPVCTRKIQDSCRNRSGV